MTADAITRAIDRLVSAQQSAGHHWDHAGAINLTVAHPLFAVFYEDCLPTVEINGTKEGLPWGSYSFALPPGCYEISCSYPWFFSSECGKRTVRIELQPGQVRSVTYCSRYVRYWPGKMTIEDR